MVKAQVITESNCSADQQNSTLKVSNQKGFSRAITFQRSLEAPSEQSVEDKKSRSKKDNKPYRKRTSIKKEGSMDSPTETTPTSSNFGFGNYAGEFRRNNTGSSFGSGMGSPAHRTDHLPHSKWDIKALGTIAEVITPDNAIL